jgi:hypothetical protein
MIVHKRLLKSQIHPGYGLFSGDGKSQIVGDTSIRLMDSTTDNDTIFQQSENDNKPAMSIEDKAFLSIMDKEMCKDIDGR